MNLVGSGTVNGKIYGSATLGTLAPTTSGGIEIDLLNGGDSLTAFTGEEVATVQIVLRSDTAESWYVNNPILAAGEIGYNNEDKQLFVGDGVTAYQDFTNEHYIVHWDDFESALNSFDGRFTSIESNVTALQSDVSTLQSNLESSNTFLSQLQEGLNDAVADISSLQSDISSEASTRSTAVTSLQGQIDSINTSLADGLLKKLELTATAADIIANGGSLIDIITPSSGKYIHLISGCVVYSGTTQSGKSVTINFYQGASVIPSDAFQPSSIDDSGNYGKINLALGTDIANPYFGVDQPLQIMFSDSGISGSDLTLRLIIFYMEV